MSDEAFALALFFNKYDLWTKPNNAMKNKEKGKDLATALWGETRRDGVQKEEHCS